jgi:two-component system response regulator (stage 0 sporulation protein F)
MEKVDCFRKGRKDCDQFLCSFRKDCLSPRVMVVDDEESMRFVFKEELEEEGYIVECASNGEEALEKLPIFKPDLISLDIKMPVMDGIEALKHIREREKLLPIILCSAYGEYKQDLTTWASDAYVVKCADLTNWKSTIRRLLSLSEDPHEIEISRFKNYISLLRESKESLEKQLYQLPKGQNGNTARPLEGIEKADLVRYLKLLSQSYQLANHDIMNSVRGIQGAVSICRDMVQEILGNMANLAGSPSLHHISGTLSKCLEIINEEGEQLTNYLSSFYRLYSQYPSLEDENLLVSSLVAIVSKVREQNANAAINILDTSPQNLTVIFPPWLLYGVISELVNNAIHHVGPACRIIIEWNIENNSLIIGIHDSGSTNEELQKSYYPFQEFCEIQAITRKEGGGLQLICSILALAGGLVLFTKSPRLGGLLVHIRIPVTSQCIQGA